MLVEVLISVLIITTSLMASSQLLSSLRFRNLRDTKEQEAVQLAQDELERALASKKEGHAWFWASVCTNNAPCHTEHKPNGWWLSQGTAIYGDFTVGSWFDHDEGDRKRIHVQVIWDIHGGGEISREILVTNILK